MAWKNFTIRRLSVVGAALIFSLGPDAYGDRQIERLGRGVVAIPNGNGAIFVSWRPLATDPEGSAFNLYRSTAGGQPIRLNGAPLTRGTNYVDTAADSARTKQDEAQEAQEAPTLTSGITGKEQRHACWMPQHTIALPTTARRAIQASAPTSWATGGRKSFGEHGTVENCESSRLPYRPSTV